MKISHATVAINAFVNLALLRALPGRMPSFWRKIRQLNLVALAVELRMHLFHSLHKHATAADIIYRFAYRFKALSRSARHWLAAVHPVKIAHLYRYRINVRLSELSLNATNICNAKCAFCAYPKVVQNKTLKTGIMQLALFQRAVDEFALAGGRTIDLTPVVGEPLVDPGLIDKLKYIRSRIENADIRLTTNGILLNQRDKYRSLIDNGVTFIGISTQGTSREMYTRVYGTDKYEQVMAGLFNLLDYNKRKGEPATIVIRFRNAQKPSDIVTSPDYQRYIAPFFSQKVRVNFTVDYDNWGGTITQRDLVGTMRLRRPGPQINVPCIGLFSLAVRHDGKVRLCGCRLKHTDADDLIVGDINSQTLRDIMTGENAWRITEGFYSGNRPETCKQCTLYAPVTNRWLEQRAKLI